MASPSTIDQFIFANGKYFPAPQIPYVREVLSTLDDERIAMLYAQDYKDPTLMIIVSIFGGSLGIDRFLLGEVGLGVAKLLTGGGCGVWWIVDLFLIMDRAREKNLEMFLLAAR